MADLRIGIIICSDTRSAGTTEDTAGPALVAAVEEYGWTPLGIEIVPDKAETIATAIVHLADTAHADVVLTSGGTGFGPRDVTPEATLEACDRVAPGIAEAIRASSMEITRRAMLSRGVAGLRGTTLVVNLPGSPKGAVESLSFIADQLDHAVEMMAGGGHA